MILNTNIDAEVVELVDTLDSKSNVSNDVRVRVPPSVLHMVRDRIKQSGFFIPGILVNLITENYHKVQTHSCGVSQKKPDAPRRFLF